MNKLYDDSLKIVNKTCKSLSSLEKQKAALQQDIHNLNAGVVQPLSDVEQREAIREVYQLADVLIQDFRHLEE